jgi:hypothetical protein
VKIRNLREEEVKAIDIRGTPPFFLLFVAVSMPLAILGASSLI